MTLPRLRDLMSLAIIVAICTNTVLSDATLEIKLKQYDNPSEKDYNNGCCDIWCLTQCDHLFQMSLDLGNSDNNAKGHHYWSQTSHAIRDQNVNDFSRSADVAGIKNPIVHVFKPSWPGSVKFKVYVEDDDYGTSRNDHVDDLVKTIHVSRAARAKGESKWIPAVMYGQRTHHRTSLSFEYMVYCNENYYTADCSVHCVAGHSNSTGQYTCDPDTGQIVCRPGWEDVSTNCTVYSDDCVNHQCKNGATCIDGAKTYSCRCPPGFTGNRCDTEPVVSSDVCSADRACKNGGICTGRVCRCRPRYIGDLCEIDVCSYFSCQNGGRCINGSCLCTPGFTGQLCQTNINDCFRDTCKNDGTCEDRVNGYVCRCRPQYGGATCTELLPAPRSSQSDDEPPSSTDVEEEKTNPLEIWFYVSIGVIALLIVIIIALAIYICFKRRDWKKSTELDDGPRATSSGRRRAARSSSQIELYDTVSRDDRSSSVRTSSASDCIDIPPPRPAKSNLYSNNLYSNLAEPKSSKSVA